MENAAAVKAERAAACRAAKNAAAVARRASKDAAAAARETSRVEREAAQRVADGGHKHPDAKIRATVRTEQYEHLLDDLEDNPCAFYDSLEFD